MLMMRNSSSSSRNPRKSATAAQRRPIEFGIASRANTSTPSGEPRPMLEVLTSPRPSITRIAARSNGERKNASAMWSQ